MRFNTLHATARAVTCAAILTTAFVVQAANVSAGGVEFEDQTAIGADKLVLNGAGVRWRTIFKVYSAGLYLSRKSATLEEVIAAPGAKRIRLVMLRDIDADDLSQLFIRGVMRNMPRAESTRLTTIMLRLSDSLAEVKRFGPGDVITIDYDPKTGTSFHATGQQRGETVPGPLVFEAAMHIWLGADPADWKLKDLLLGKSASGASVASN